MVKRIAIGLLLLGIWLASSWTLIRPGFFRIHDFVHGARVGEMARALADGHFPVRWSQNFGFGFGMPLFEFYAPLPYYIGGALYLAGVDVVLILKVLFAGVSLFTLIGAYYLGKELSGRMGGVLVSALITLAPYRAVNLYIRGALSEAWGMMALPWVLLGLIWLIRNKKAGWLVLTLSLTALLLSHNLTALMFIPLSYLVGWGWLLIENWGMPRFGHRIIGTATKITGSYLLAAGLAAFYFVPAYGEKGYTKVASIVGGYFDFNLHFLYLRQFITPGWGYGGSTWGPDDGISFFLGWGQWFGLALLAGSLGWWGWQRWRQRSQSLAFADQKIVLKIGLLGLAAAVCFLMSIGKSKPIWDLLPPLAFIQFPWRWLSPAIVLLSGAIGLSLQLLPHRFWRLAATLGLFIVLTVGNTQLFQPESYLENADAFYYTNPSRIQVDMSSVLQDYIPIQMTDTLKIEPKPQPNLILSQVPAMETKVILDRVHEKLIATNLTQPARIEVAVADFPGWFAEIDGEHLAIGHGPRGTITIDVPAGEHMIGLRFGYTRLRLMSDVLSLISLLVLFYLSLPRLNLHGKIDADD
jgi:hypothetical protein